MIKYIKENWRKMIPFALVGGVFNIVEFGGSFLLIENVGLKISVGYAIAFVIATVIAFVLNTFFTFKSEFSLSNLLRYLTIYLIAMGIGQLVIFILTKGIHIQQYIDIKDGWLPLFTLPFVYIWNFMMTNRFLEK